MLDLKFIRENTDLVRQSLKSRNDSAPLDDILELDLERRKNLTELEDLRHARKGGTKLSPEEGRELRTKVKTLEDSVSAIDEKLRDLLLRIPNVPDPTVPIGKDDSENVVLRNWGEPRKFDFTPAPHWQLGESLDIIDFERGVKLSGTRFYVLKGLGARLQRALIAFMLDLHTREQGYTEIYPPFMVKRECMVAAGQLPKFADNIYHDAEEDYWFVGTAEIPLTALHSGEILPPGSLPLNYTAYTACFRREKMAAGKDTRGIKRGHQFDKVEMYKLVEPDKSEAELEQMVKDAGAVCERLELPYRIKLQCTGDLSFASHRTYDVEIYSPGVDEWLEVSSCSNCGDFQARRANIRYRPAPDEKPQFVHTLNGSGLGMPRVLISVLENYQQADGSIRVPQVLQPFMGCDVIK
jgi:seryl-tRNA synthetase